MKIQIASDLHREFLSPGQDPITVLQDVGADVLVLAGDIHQHVNGLLWAASLKIAQHIIYVPGNHEYYNANIHQLSVELRHLAGELTLPQIPIHLLDNREVVIGGSRFLGTTLWTDFAINGEGTPQFLALQAAKNVMADFRCIGFGSTGWLSPQRSIMLHKIALEWLAQTLAIPFDGPTIVITHHCPHPDSVAERFKGDVLTPGFCSDLSWVIEKFHPELWIHGHTHDSFDYVVPWSDGSGGTRVVCNPRGYLFENSMKFDPAKVVTVDGDTRFP